MEPLFVFVRIYEDEKIKILIAAAGRAPSSNNEQPWLFVYTTRESVEKFNDFLEFLTESNRVWARMLML